MTAAPTGAAGTPYYMAPEQHDREGFGAPGRLGSASLYDSTFSRTVWRLYGGAKGLAMWY